MPYKNKSDQAAASQKHYEANKDKIKLRSKIRNISQRQKNRDYVRKAKEFSGCVDCGESNFIVLDFDHVSGNKIMCVSNMINKAYSLKAIQMEIDKCEVRWSNCHRIVTQKRFQETKNA